MPALDAGAGHVGGDKKRFADEAVVQVIADALQPGAQKGIRRTADLHAFFSGQLQKLFRFGQRGGKGFFAEQVLAGPQDLAVHRDVHLRRRQIDDDVHLIVRQQLFHRVRMGDAELLREGGRALHIEVRTGRHVQRVVKRLDVRQIGAADHPGAQNAHFVATHSVYASSRLAGRTSFSQFISTIFSFFIYYSAFLALIFLKKRITRARFFVFAKPGPAAPAAQAPYFYRLTAYIPRFVYKVKKCTCHILHFL